MVAMLFVASEFLLYFLPIVLAGHWLVDRWLGSAWSRRWLIGASLVFYGSSGWPELGLFLASLAVNYLLGRWLASTERRWVLPLAIALNLSLLGLFKYGDFLLSNLASLAGAHVEPLGLDLPLAISFYTFQQIVYLVQCRRDRKAAIGWEDYALAVAFFPHLIAGPLVHYHDLIAQFRAPDRETRARGYAHEALNLFVVALAKKLLIADMLAPVSAEIFGAAEAGAALRVADAWMGVLAYAFQIYFDFSAYSEMALGLGLMFGVRLPVNFRRPYLAEDLRDFWKRWHITLSEFLRDYLYIPLGGSRRGAVRRWLNLFLTMLLGGLWHGAGWNFVAWGGLHGLLLAVNHAWAARAPFRLPRGISVPLTFLVVLLLWVPFNAKSWQGTARIWRAMAGAPEAGVKLDGKYALEDGSLKTVVIMLGEREDGYGYAFWKFLKKRRTFAWIAVGGAALLVFACRSNLERATDPRARSVGRALALGFLIFAVLAHGFSAEPGEFIYFRF